MAKKPRASSPTPRAGKSALLTVEIRLDPEIIKQIKIDAIATDRTVSQVITDLWRATPRQFWLRRAAGPGDPPAVADASEAAGPRLADAS